MTSRSPQRSGAPRPLTDYVVEEAECESSDESESGGGGDDAVHTIYSENSDDASRKGAPEAGRREYSGGEANKARPQALFGLAT